MVDRALPKKRWTTKRLLTIGGILGILLLIFGSYYYTSGKSRLYVDYDRLTVSTVHKGTFQENIPVNGMVVPLYSIYLDATEGGRMEEKYVEDGAIMKKGQPILRLSNTNLSLNMVTQETNVYNNLTQMRIASNAALENTVGKLNADADVESALREAERVYLLDKKLYEEKAIGLQDYRSAENLYNYQRRKKKLSEQILVQDSVANEQQLQQAKQTLQGAKDALKIIQEQVGELVVRAPIDGQLTSMTAEIGENINVGERLGQLDVLTGFKVRVDVDQHYISRVFTGQTATWTNGDSTYRLKIVKVYTQVNANGTFQVDMHFLGAVPSGIRRGQTLQILLALSDEKQAVMVPKGGFFQNTGGNWIFKMSDDGKIAFKTDITLGNQNTDYYEVISGLKPGDNVITSSYESYGTIQELVIKK